MSQERNEERERRKELMTLINKHQRRIFAYIYTLVPSVHDAEDLLQETLLVICEKFDSFKLGSDFPAWACQIAYWRVRYSRQKYARAKVLFDQEVFDAVAETVGSMAQEMDDRREALSGCLEKLSARDRELVLSRYEPGLGVETAAARSGRSLQAAYKALARIRKRLFDCVSKNVPLEGLQG